MSTSTASSILFCGLLAAFVSAPLSAAEHASPKRESIEWLDVWVTQGDHPDATPRVLLIGDSITRAYYPEVEKRLEGIAICDRLATSSSLGDPALPLQIALVLHQYHYDVIHFNNGMHGPSYTEAEYAAAIPGVLAVLHHDAPHAKLIWATTTPTGGPNASRNPQIDERNRLVRAAIAGKEILLDDLHAVVAANLQLISGDGVHMAGPGSTALATQVAESIQAVLPKAAK